MGSGRAYLKSKKAELRPMRFDLGPKMPSLRLEMADFKSMKAESLKGLI